MGPKKFTEPVALSSPQPTDLPLARTTSRLGFDLLAPRARCKGQSRRRARGPQAPLPAKRPQFAFNGLSTFPRLPRRPGDNRRSWGMGAQEAGVEPSRPRNRRLDITPVIVRGVWTGALTEKGPLGDERARHSAAVGRPAAPRRERRGARQRAPVRAERGARAARARSARDRRRLSGAREADDRDRRGRARGR